MSRNPDLLLDKTREAHNAQNLPSFEDRTNVPRSTAAAAAPAVPPRDSEQQEELRKREERLHERKLEEFRKELFSSQPRPVQPSLSQVKAPSASPEQTLKQKMEQEAAQKRRKAELKRL